MINSETYRPERIEFPVAVDDSGIPESLGRFKSAEEALKFMGARFISTSEDLTVNRYMDVREKDDRRKQYSDILENLVPTAERQLITAEQNLNNAKKEQKNAEEIYSGYVQ